MGSDTSAIFDQLLSEQGAKAVALDLRLQDLAPVRHKEHNKGGMRVQLIKNSTCVGALEESRRG